MPSFSAALLSKFLKGLCTEEEAEVVAEYFRQHPEAIHLMDEYEEAEEGAVLPEGYREEMLAAIVQVTGQGVDGQLGGAKMKVIGRWVAAACVLLLVAGWWLLSRPKGGMEEKAPLQAALWVGRHNADGKKILLLLPDSSEAVLSPGATIRYRTDFGHYAKREVKIEGRASFSVVRNEQRPFVVISDMVSTVVLGTVFEVAAEKNSDVISVRLQSGKVLVTIDPVRDSSREYMLKPGEEFVFGKANGSVVIRDFVHGPNVARRMGRPGKPDTLFNWYMFNNQPLADVLQQLSNLYNVEIDYSKDELHNLYFIGRLEKKDSLGETLGDIALLNHLKVTLRDGRYIITKRKP
jgi:transmembrane sensor